MLFLIIPCASHPASSWQTALRTVWEGSDDACAGSHRCNCSCPELAGAGQGIFPWGFIARVCRAELTQTHRAPSDLIKVTLQTNHPGGRNGVKLRRSSTALQWGLFLWRCHGFQPGIRNIPMKSLLALDFMATLSPRSSGGFAR